VWLGSKAFNDKVRLYWRYDNDKIYLRLEGDCKSYIALGWNPNDKEGEMVDADMAIVSKQGAELVLGDYKSDGFFTPTADKKDDLEDKDFGQDETKTWLQFSRKWKTDDERDKEIFKTDNVIIWAFGESNDLTYHGHNRGHKHVDFSRNGHDNYADDHDDDDDHHHHHHHDHNHEHHHDYDDDHDHHHEHHDHHDRHDRHDDHHHDHHDRYDDHHHDRHDRHHDHDRYHEYDDHYHDEHEDHWDFDHDHDHYHDHDEGHWDDHDDHWDDHDDHWDDHDKYAWEGKDHDFNDDDYEDFVEDLEFYADYDDHGRGAQKYKKH